jgi:hypothetical protein
LDVVDLLKFFRHKQGAELDDDQLLLT